MSDNVHRNVVGLLYKQ